MFLRSQNMQLSVGGARDNTSDAAMRATSVRAHHHRNGHGQGQQLGTKLGTNNMFGPRVNREPEASQKSLVRLVPSKPLCESDFTIRV